MELKQKQQNNPVNGEGVRKNSCFAEYKTLQLQLRINEEEYEERGKSARDDWLFYVISRKRLTDILKGNISL